jgi:hypothetical protein
VPPIDDSAECLLVRLYLDQQRCGELLQRLIGRSVAQGFKHLDCEIATREVIV